MWNLVLPGEQVVEHRLARLAEVLRHAVEQLRVPDLVLDLGRQRELSAQGRRAHQPFAFGEHAHQLAVGVHLDESEDGRPVLVRHPVGRLDLAAGGDVRLEQGEPLVVRQVVVERGAAALERPEDRLERERIGHDGPLGAWTARSARSANASAMARAESRPSGLYQPTRPLSAVRRKAAVAVGSTGVEGPGPDPVGDDCPEAGLVGIASGRDLVASAPLERPPLVDEHARPLDVVRHDADVGP